jgi:hypothetical protein
MSDAMQAVTTGVIRAALADATLFGLIGGRIVEAESPTLKDLELPAMAIRYIPGRVRYPLQVYHVFNFQVLVYSRKSYSELREVYNAFMDALDGMRFTRDSVNFVIRKTQAPSLDMDQETEEYILSCFWEAKAVG